MVYNPAFTATDTSSLDRLMAQTIRPQKTYEQQMAEYEAALAAEDRQNQADGRSSYDRLVRQSQTNSQQQAQADAEIKAARDEAYGLARGAVSRQNPIDAQLLQVLQNRVASGPYDQTTKDALMTSASDMAAQQQLNAKGRISGNASDPSVIAANNEADARRSQAVQQAQLGINTQANLANYAAQGQAASQLGNYNRQMQDAQVNNERYLTNMLTNEQRTVRTDPGIPTYEEYARANGYGARMALPPVRQAQAQQPRNSGTILHTGGNSGDTLAAQAQRFAGNQVQTYQPGKVVTGMNKVDATAPVRPATNATNTVGPMAGGYQAGQPQQSQYQFGVYKPMAQKNPYNTNMLPRNTFGG